MNLKQKIHLSKSIKHQLFTISYLNFPYFVIIKLQMCVSCMIQRPFLWQVCSVSAFHIPVANEMLVNQELVLHSVESSEKIALNNIFF